MSNRTILLLAVLAMFSCCASVSADTLLDAHWSFDTDFSDSTPNNRDGAGSSGTVTPANNVTSAAGEFQIGGGALTLDGSGDHISITGYKGITGTDSRTVSAWIKAAAADDNQAIINWGTNSNGQKWTVRLQDDGGTADGALRTEVNGGFQIGDSEIADGTWHHVAVRWEDDGTPNVLDVRLYVDGVLESINASQTNGINTASGVDVRIGQDFGSRAWTGGLDDVGIFAQAISDEKIGAIYSLGDVLGYDLTNADSLFDLFDDGDADLLEIDGLLWEFVASGLTGNPGEVTPDGNGGFSLILNSTNGSGLQTAAVPEPASIALWSLLGLLGLAVGYRFRRRS